LPAWFENISKRQIKAPKIYFRDSGLYHTLLGIEQDHVLLTHPKLGASWEGFALEEIIRYHQATAGECYFWGTQSNAELDLLIIKKGKRFGFEFKYTDSPKTTRSMQIALEDLKLDSLTVIYPGKHFFPLSSRIHACGLEEYANCFLKR
jgi:predicted AAA+ superfamily ATPase